MGENTQLRLLRARSALHQAEGQQGVRSYSHRLLEDRSMPAGVYEVGGSVARLVSAMTAVRSAESWMAMIGVVDFGWEAAERAGVDLRRVVIVNSDPLQAPAVISTLLEGFEVAVVGDVALSLPQQRTIAARARMLDRFVLTVRSWPLCSARLFSMDSGSAAAHENQIDGWRRDVG